MVTDMTIGDLETKAAGWALKNIVWIVVGTVVFLLAFWAFYVLIIGPMNAKHDAAAIHGQGVVDKADAAAAHGAIPVIEKTNSGEAGVAAKGRDHVIFITKQPGADTVVPDALWSAIVGSVCMRDSAAGDPECERLRKPHP